MTWLDKRKPLDTNKSVTWELATFKDTADPPAAGAAGAATGAAAAASHAAAGASDAAACATAWAVAGKSCPVHLKHPHLRCDGSRPCGQSTAKCVNREP